MNNGTTTNDGTTEFNNFRDLTRRLLAVPKSEVPKHVAKKRAKPPAKNRKGN